MAISPITDGESGADSRTSINAAIAAANALQGAEEITSGGSPVAANPNVAFTVCHDGGTKDAESITLADSTRPPGFVKTFLIGSTGALQQINVANSDQFTNPFSAGSTPGTVSFVWTAAGRWVPASAVLAASHPLILGQLILASLLTANGGIHTNGGNLDLGNGGNISSPIGTFNNVGVSNAPQILNFTDFKLNPGLTTISLDIGNLGPGGSLYTLIGTRLITDTAFGGGSISAATFSLGIPGEPTKFATGLDAMAGDGTDYTTPFPAWFRSDAQPMRITLELTGGTAADLAAGQVEVRYLMFSF